MEGLKMVTKGWIEGGDITLITKGFLIGGMWAFIKAVWREVIRFVSHISRIVRLGSEINRG